MNVSDKVTIIKKLDVTDLAGEKVMIDFETGKYFMIKGSGNDIWDILQESSDIQTIISKLLEMYEVDEATCKEAVLQFLEQMLDNGFIKIGE